MIVQLNARTPYGGLLNLPLQDTSSGYVVGAIEGLAPGRAILSTSTFSSIDGVAFHSARRDQRDIRIRIEFESNPRFDDVENLRNNLYRYFQLKQEVELEFVRSTGTSPRIRGRVESVESVFFAQNPAVDIQVVCFDPYFYDATPTVLNLNTTSSTATTEVDYAGSAPTGVKLTITPPRTISDLTLSVTSNYGRTISLVFNAGINANQTLTITTHPGNKTASRRVGGTVSSILYGVSPSSFWPQLEPGINLVRAAVSGTAIPYTLEYTTRYGGL